jgi:hypothetical protein
MVACRISTAANFWKKFQKIELRPGWPGGQRRRGVALRPAVWMSVPQIDPCGWVELEREHQVSAESRLFAVSIHYGDPDPQ